MTRPDGDTLLRTASLWLVQARRRDPAERCPCCDARGRPDDGRVDGEVYAGQTGRVRGSDTSAAAGDSVQGSGRAQAMRHRILEWLCAQGLRGATCEEVEFHFQLRHQTASARLRELVVKGLVLDTEGRRKTSSGSLAMVRVAALAAEDESCPE